MDFANWTVGVEWEDVIDESSHDLDEIVVFAESLPVARRLARSWWRKQYQRAFPTLRIVRVFGLSVEGLALVE